MSPPGGAGAQARWSPYPVPTGVPFQSLPGMTNAPWRGTLSVRAPLPLRCPWTWGPSEVPRPVFCWGGKKTVGGPLGAEQGAGAQGGSMTPPAQAAHEGPGRARMQTRPGALWPAFSAPCYHEAFPGRGRGLLSLTRAVPPHSRGFGRFPRGRGTAGTAFSGTSLTSPAGTSADGSPRQQERRWVLRLGSRTSSGHRARVPFGPDSGCPGARSSCTQPAATLRLSGTPWLLVPSGLAALLS